MVENPKYLFGKVGPLHGSITPIFFIVVSFPLYCHFPSTPTLFGIKWQETSSQGSSNNKQQPTRGRYENRAIIEHTIFIWPWLSKGQKTPNSMGCTVGDVLMEMVECINDAYRD